MIFSELYGAYYNAMAKILAKAIEHPLKKGELRSIVDAYAFEESILNIETAIDEERWQLIKKDGTTPIMHVPSMPLTILQKRWLKAITLDPRIKLFEEEISGLDEIEPLFTREDFFIFDKYADGDNFEDAAYIKNFGCILDAIRNKHPLEITTMNRKGNILSMVVMPKWLEYSQKDDKFRLIGVGRKSNDTINLGRIITCEPYTKEYIPKESVKNQESARVVEFELIDERNALERVLLHFAHFKKQAERLEETRYKVTVAYDAEDEIEVLIRILSFGPMVRVIGPDNFVNLIKERLKRQKSCGR